MPHKLTVLVTCKNERSNIGLCLESVRGIADELLVADSGSTDGTLEYVLSRGDCRVIERDYRTAGDFKNWAVPQARHEWVLIVECDERVTPALASEIRGLLAAGPTADGYWITRTNHLLGRPMRHTDWGRDRLLRLVRRDLCRYVGTGDHQIAIVAGGNTAALRAPLLHYTMWSWSQYMRKFDRYTRVQAREWYAAGKRPSWFKMLVRPPLRFFRDYILHRGFLEGTAGLQLAWLAAFYTFMKQAQLWELHHGLSQRQVEAEALVALDARGEWSLVDDQSVDERRPMVAPRSAGGRRPVAA